MDVATCPFRIPTAVQHITVPVHVTVQAYTTTNGVVMSHTQPVSARNGRAKRLHRVAVWILPNPSSIRVLLSLLQ